MERRSNDRPAPEAPSASRDEVTELKAAVAARRELGPEMEDHVLEAFLARMQQRMDAQIVERTSKSGSKPVKSSKHDAIGVEMIAAPLALSIPLIAIAGHLAGLAGVIAVMVALVLLEFMYFVDRWVRFSLK
jgi:hypothetical protein